MKGKTKCKILKQIRQKIADENEIPYVTRECTYQGECRGTCPKCEAELRYLERELEQRKRLGKAVAVAAVAAGLSLSLSACVPGSGDASGADRSAGGTSVSEPTQESIRPGNTGQNIEGKAVQETDVYELEGDVAFLPDEPVTAEPLLGEIAVLETEPEAAP